MLTKKKILHLITGLEVGGAEIMLLKTLPRLQDGFDNRVCCITGHGPIGRQLENAGIPVFYLDLRLMSAFGSILQFRNTIKNFQPDLLVTYLIHADLFGRIFGYIFGVKKIVCSQRGKLLQWEFLRLADFLTKHLVTKYIVQTEVAKQELMQKLRLPAGKISIIPNAIDLTEFEFELDKEKKRASLGLSTNNMIITCVSKLRYGKGHEYLLEAFEEIYKEHPKVKLLIVGDGERKQELLNQTLPYSSRSSILFLGNRYDVKEILRISDIFVLPTLGEGMSNAIMEAMASNLPIVTTNIPENQELIKDKNTGIVVPIRNPLLIATAIVSLVDKEGERSLLGKNAKQHIATKFDILATIKKVSALYNQLLA